MASLETKIIQVENSPNVINQANAEWGSFGWNVQNVQITHSQDTRTYTKTAWDVYSGDKTVETTTINYATITYQRDRGMENYQAVSQLEYEYNSALEQMESIITNAPDASINWFIAIWLLCLFPIGIFYLIAKFRQKKQREKYFDDNEAEFVRLKEHRESLRHQAGCLVR